MNVPLSDPKASYLAQQAEIDLAARRVLESGAYILGNEVREFEREFASFIGVSRGIGAASGTDAIELALRACGVARGDIVITVSHTAVATVSAIESAGASACLVDIEEKSYCMDPGALEAALRDAEKRGTRVKAIVPVHLYGLPADLPKICELGKQFGCAVIEDCAQAHGASIDGRRCGTFGNAAAFSFYPTKNLGAFGDGGITVTSDEGLAERMTVLRQYGWRERYISSEAGINSRLDELQAAILRVKLGALEAANKRRQAIAAFYRKNIAAGSGLLLPDVRQGCEHVYHLFIVRSSDRPALMAHLSRRGIGTGIHYPAPVHRQPAYSHLAHDRLSCTERISAEILSLPMYPELTDAQIERVCEAINSFR